MSRTVGLVGARGHTGRELIRLLAGRPDMALSFASSRAMAGEAVSGLAPEAPKGLVFEALGPEDTAARGADAVILGVHGAGLGAVDLAFPALPVDAAVLVFQTVVHLVAARVIGVPLRISGGGADGHAGHGEAHHSQEGGLLEIHRTDPAHW